MYIAMSKHEYCSDTVYNCDKLRTVNYGHIYKSTTCVVFTKMYIHVQKIKLQLTTEMHEL
jgi:hypothetical protein